MKHEKTKKPWLNKNGEPHTIEVLRDISKSWSPKTWEDYLSTLESERNESSLSPGELEREIERHSLESYFKKSNEKEKPTDVSEELIEKVIKAFSQLPWFQRRVLNCFYARSLRLCEVADELDLSKSHVSYYRDLALHNLKAAFSDLPPYDQKKGNGGVR